MSLIYETPGTSVTFFYHHLYRVWFCKCHQLYESPVKFTAPSLTLAVGLDVGRHVFAALNKAEIVFALTNLLLLFVAKPPARIIVLFSVVGLILSLQTVWLLPALDTRALVIISGNTPPPSYLHMTYIVVEAIKLVALFVLGCSQVGYFTTEIITITSSQKRKAA